VANIDDDPTLEILITTIANGPLHAWNADGSQVPGWPPIFPTNSLPASPAAGNIQSTNTKLEVFSVYYGCQMFLYSDGGKPLNSWFCNDGGTTEVTPSMADVDGDGLEEIFVPEGDWKMHAYESDGTPVPGWPVSISVQRSGPASFADLDKGRSSAAESLKNAPITHF
jgi:hypothetical protein